MVVFLATNDSEKNPKKARAKRIVRNGPARQGELDLGVVSLGEKGTPALTRSHCLTPVDMNIE
jgi:hypothetical protein